MTSLRLPGSADVARHQSANIGRWSMPLTRLGFGAAPIGNLYSEVGDDEAQATLRAAWNDGIRFFDTAPFYGHGLSERRLGQVFATWPRDSFAVSSKVGRCIEKDGTRDQALNDGFAVHGSRAVFDYSRDGVLRSVEASLQRLRVTHLDLLLLHDVGRLTHGAAHAQMLRQALEEALPTMAALRDAGTVGAIGIGVNEVEVCNELMPKFDLDCILLAGRYTLLEQRDALATLDEAQRRGVGVIVAGPYNSGLLGSAQAPGATYDYAPANAETLRRARNIYEICAQEDVDVGAAALQFPLAHPAVAGVVAGLRSVAEVECAAARRDAKIPARTWHRLQQANIIVSEAPVPT